MDARKFFHKRTIGLFVFGLLMVAVGVWMVSVQRLPGGEDLPGATQPARIQTECVMRQTLNYQRCGHSVVRTLDVPAEWVGMDRAQMEEQLDMSWRITDFGPLRITMQRNLMLFCPQHWVLMPDETGRVCIWVNRYGEGMERVYETEWLLANMPETEGEQVRIGKAFDLLEEAEGFLEGLEP
ncbi:MAG TPA: hypothetical protein PKE04_00970 [Clostridia bacterium]|nr:hypothetical protein [Clostridia bacterium]